MLKSSKLQPCLLKKSWNTQNKLKELEIMYQYVIYVCISWYRKTRWLADKNANVSRTQGICHVINTFSGSSLGKV